MDSYNYLPRGYAVIARDKLFFEGYDNISLHAIYNEKRFGNGSHHKEIKTVLLSIAVNNYQTTFNTPP